MKEDYDISETLAEIIADKQNETLITMWKFIYFKDQIQDLDLIWIDALTHEMCFRTSLEKINSRQANPLQ